MLVALLGTAVALAVLFGSTGLSGASPVPRANTTRSVHYVALGDSYTAGPLIPTQLDDPPGCLRSDHNYPHVLAQARHLRLTDVSCSGATIANMRGPQRVAGFPNPPQLDAVSRDAALVTIGIGGNDLGFISILEHCAAASPDGPTSVGLDCRSHYVVRGVDTLARRIVATGQRVRRVVTAVHARAPWARVYVVGYPAILPPSGPGCWPRLPFTKTDVAFLRSTEVALNAALAGAARRGHAFYVNVYGPSADRNACTAASVRWVEPLVPSGKAAPVHPNASGEAAMARIVSRAVNRHGIGRVPTADGR